jgi:hypothetical protein
MPNAAQAAFGMWPLVVVVEVVEGIGVILSPSGVGGHGPPVNNLHDNPMTNPTNRILSLALLTTALLHAPMVAQIERDFATVQDATVSSKNPKAADGAGDVLSVGVGDGSTETFVLFDLTAIPSDATLLSAVFSYDVASVTTTEPRLSLRRVAASWKEKTLTFDNRPTSGVELQSDRAGSSTNRFQVGVALRAVIQDWIERPGQNFGLRIRTDSGTEKNPSVAEIVSREGATVTQFAPTLRLTFARLRVATTALPIGFTGFNYRATITASALGVNSIQWRVLDALPFGFTSAVEGQALVISGRPSNPLRRSFRVEASDPVNGLQDVREFELRIDLPAGRVRTRNGHEDLEGGIFDRDNPQPIVALVPSITNEHEIDCALREINFRVMGSIDIVRDLESASLFVDTNNDGKLDASDVRVAGPQVIESVVGAIRIDVDDALLPALSTRQFLFVVQPRRGCPVGVEFAAKLGNTRTVQVVFAGTDKRTLTATSRFRGPEFACEERFGFPGDANGDGIIDCLDVQMQARRVGATAKARLDPNGNGLVDQDDVEMTLDAALGRPVVTRTEFVKDQSSNSIGFGKFFGFNFGERGELLIGGRKIRLDQGFQGDRVLLGRLDSRQSGAQDVIVRNEFSSSRPRIFNFQ